MASCSIVLPAMFLILGILIAVMGWEAKSSSRASVNRIIDVAAIIWPVVFALVVAQSLKAYIIYAAGSRKPVEQVQRPGKQSPAIQRLEVLCLLVFVVWSLAPLGSQALDHIYGPAVPTTQQVSSSLWYLDQTGYNTMWSANSTNDMSDISRSQLLQVVSERYIGSFARGTVPPDGSGQSTSFPLPMSILTGAVGSSPAVPKSGGTEAGFPLTSPSRNLGSNSSLDNAAGINQTLSFSMTVSHFKFTCGNWSTMLRNLTNTTSDRLSYSNGQTLGLTMKPGVTSETTPAGSVEFVSSNNGSSAAGAALASRGNNDTALWEYSVIQCDYQQLFYSVPIQCYASNGNNAGACVQSAGEGLIINSVGVSGTELGDFAQDFVSANLLSRGQTATASKSFHTALILKATGSTNKM